MPAVHGRAPHRFPGSAFALLTVVIASLVTIGVLAASCSRAAAPGAQREMAPSTIRESRLEGMMFFSPSLGRHMPLTVLLPPYYATSEASYPVLYMLHGQGGNLDEWQWYGIAGVAERMMLSGEIQPFIIVLPEGDNSYWFNHAYGGEAWGDYVARDIVRLVDSLYRTRPWPQARAVGGLSMGADGALQLAMNYPDVFRIAGVPSPALRP